MIADVVQNELRQKVDDALCRVTTNFKFVNTDANKWQLVVSFDLDELDEDDDEPVVSEAEKQLLIAIFKHI